MATELLRERLRVGLEKRQNRQICFLYLDVIDLFTSLFLMVWINTVAALTL